MHGAEERRSDPDSAAIVARRRAESPWDLASATLVLALVGVVLATFRDYGVSWDEPVHVANGEHLVRYYASGFADRSYRDFENLYLYGGFFDLLQDIASRPLEPTLGLYESRHLLNALFALIGVTATGWLGRSLGGPRAGFFAAAILALLPAWHGHAFNNPKDIPFAVMYALSLGVLVRLAALGSRAGLSHAFAGGVTLGLTVATRIGGLLLIAGLAVLGSLGTGVALRTGDRRAAARVTATTALALATAAAAALACWPWLLEAPLAHARLALEAAGRFPRSQPVLYLGEHLYSTDLPWHYVLVWLAVQTPLPILGLLLAGGVQAGVRAREPGSDFVSRAIVAAGLFAPLALVLLTRPVLYDAARHFLFLLPPAAVLAALAAEGLLKHVERRAPRRRIATGLATGAAIALIGLPLPEMYRLHPYQYVYFNELVGGLAGASRRFDLDYWGHSLREATLGLVARLGADAPPKRVFVCGPPVSASYYFPATFERVRSPREADLAIVLRRDFCNQPYRRLTPLLTVTREGVALSYVYDLTGSPRDKLPEIQEAR
jgi:hypothetical protein